MLEEFDFNTNKWNTPFATKFAVDLESFAKGGFREAFKARHIKGGPFKEKGFVIKTLLPDKEADIVDIIKDTLDEHVRKSVQCQMTARNLAKTMAVECGEEFGRTFEYTKVYYTKLDSKPAVIEVFLEGNFVKYINNDGELIGRSDDDIQLKAEAFVHYSYIKTKKALMVTDIQGVGYHLTDPEISTRLQKNTNEKWNFCMGNMTLLAMNRFLELHDCNDNKFCRMLKLHQS
eukprot:TCONS_00036350-protein